MCARVFPPFTSFEMKNWHFSHRYIDDATTYAFDGTGEKNITQSKVACNQNHRMLTQSVAVVSLHRHNSDVIFNRVDSQACYSNLFDNVHRTVTENRVCFCCCRAFHTS